MVKIVEAAQAIFMAKELTVLVAGIPVKIVKSTMSKIQSKQDDVDIVILEEGAKKTPRDLKQRTIQPV